MLLNTYGEIIFMERIQREWTQSIKKGNSDVKSLMVKETTLLKLHNLRHKGLHRLRVLEGSFLDGLPKLR